MNTNTSKKTFSSISCPEKASLAITRQGSNKRFLAAECLVKLLTILARNVGAVRWPILTRALMASLMRACQVNSRVRQSTYVAVND